MTSILDYLSMHLIQNMFLATIFACTLCGVIGTYVVVNKMVSITGGIAHTTFGGVGFSYYVMSVLLVGWFTPMIGALLFSIVSAIILTYCRTFLDLRQDTLIGVIWAIGMALGVIFLSSMDHSVMTPASYESILFGNVLFVGNQTLTIMIILTITVLAIVALLFEDLQILTFDEIHAKISNIKVNLLTLILYVIIAVSCVVVANVVGIIMILALMTIPTAIANLYTASLKEMMILGTIFSILFAVLGLFLALAFNSPPGATVVLIIGLVFVVSLSVKHTYGKIMNKRCKKPS
ncbi:MAG: metal ABC transporter permease [Candidatus Methanomethylophilaceae archaeon]|nr:metal ABC transporter permease [Candidatus Methanomethylophilaceae archaeon]